MGSLNWGRKATRTYRRKYSKIVKRPPSTKIVNRSDIILKSRDVAGIEIKAFADSTRYTTKNLMLVGTFSMAPGQLLRYLIVKTTSPISAYSAVFSNPSLMVSEIGQDMVTILKKGKIESSGLSGDVVKSFERFVRLGPGVPSSQHLYVIFYSSDGMKGVIENRSYIEV
ncbi:capsid protein [Parsley severe stunt associated virus]|uniref:Capsid protein n=1 Tax=Parsley severe stunt associated virus TaxID=2558055 RepID=A0A482G1X8_9VIRU|nr:capsid protein [Parsley severe stunt associated virus]QBO55989.1 capsid protein [Parsley severe stunt associated virus]